MNSHISNPRSMKRSWLASAVIALLAASSFAVAPSALAHVDIGIGINVGVAPPLLPVYEQPEIPGYGYIWTPGYWAWDDEISDYYWVPGTWVRPPRIGVLWTPGYWAWRENRYFFNEGYWGQRVGYYGGINYGYGYLGNGYAGGEWRNGGLYYNQAYNRFGNGVRITNVYNRTVVNNINITNNRYSFNGPNGVNREATREELVAQNQRRIAAVAEQRQLVQAARRDTALRASVNHGAPAVAAVPRPAAFVHQRDLRGSANALKPHPNSAPASAHGIATSEARRSAAMQHRDAVQQRAHAANARPERTPHVQGAHAGPERQPHMQGVHAGPERQPRMQGAYAGPERQPHMQGPRAAPERQPRMQGQHAGPERQAQMQGPHAGPERQAQMQGPRPVREARPVREMRVAPPRQPAAPQGRPQPNQDRKRPVDPNHGG